MDRGAAHKNASVDPLSGPCTDGGGCAVHTSGFVDPLSGPCTLPTSNTWESLVMLLKACRLLPNLGKKVWADDNDIFHFYF